MPMHATTPSHRPTRGHFAALLAFLLVVFAAAGLGAIGSRDAPAIYQQLTLPAWAPLVAMPVIAFLCYLFYLRAASFLSRAVIRSGQIAGAATTFGVQGYCDLRVCYEHEGKRYERRWSVVVSDEVKALQPGDTVPILVDCDQDALVVYVEQMGGGCCHTGRNDCFYRKVAGRSPEGGALLAFKNEE